MHAYPCSFLSQCCVGMVVSQPPGSRVRERWIGLIYAPRGAAGKFNDPPYCQHHGALFPEGHEDVMKTRPAYECAAETEAETAATDRREGAAVEHELIYTRSGKILRNLHPLFVDS